MIKKIDWYRVLAILIILLGIAYFYLNVFAPRLIPKPLLLGVIRRPLTILILGTDLTFDAETGKIMSDTFSRTDTILLLRVDPVRHKTYLLSIPRDSFVEIPGYGWQKINSAHVWGGTKLTIKTLTNLTGKKIDNFVEVNPKAVIELVNLLGGLRIYVEKDMYYVDHAQNLNINLKKGWQKLSGKEAHDYLRFRHDDQGDIGRIARQQKFLTELFRTFAYPTNLIKVPAAFKIALKNIETDLSPLTTIRLLNFFRTLDVEKNIKAFTASGEVSAAEKVGSIWALDKAYLKEIIRQYF